MSIESGAAMDIRSILVGAALRGRPQQYQKEIDRVLPKELANVAISYDLHDGDDDWGPSLESCQALVLTSRGLGAEAIERAGRLRFVQKLGRSIERVDIDACRERDITVSVLPDAGHVAVAEHTIALILACVRRLIMSHEAVLRGDNPKKLIRITTTQTERYPNWLGLEEDLFRPLSDLTLGLVGYGEIAREVAWRARAIGMKIVYTTRSGPQGHADEDWATYTSLQELLSSADIVSVHATQPDGVPAIIGRRELNLMRKDAVLVNTARGNQVDQEALLAALMAGELGGAALDVFQIEPVDPDILKGVPNLIVTPHTASNAPLGSRFKAALLNILSFSRGRDVAGTV